jgi:hypothetical protein
LGFTINVLNDACIFDRSLPQGDFPAVIEVRQICFRLISQHIFLVFVGDIRQVITRRHDIAGKIIAADDDAGA